MSLEVVIRGPAKSGKSTLAHLIAGYLEKAITGSVRLEDDSKALAQMPAGLDVVVRTEHACAAEADAV